MGGAHAGGKGRFKGLDLAPADVLAAAQHPQHGVIEFRPQVGELLTEAEGRHLHKGNLKPSLQTTAVPVLDAT